MALDLGIREDDVIEYLMFTGDKIGDHMDVAMTKADGKAYFGAAPPDLTLVARVRGVDWLYSYLRAFYLDDTRPFGVNNLVFPNVGMPHVLWELQGWQKPVYKTVTDSEGHEHQVVESLVDALERLRGAGAEVGAGRLPQDGNAHELSVPVPVAGLYWLDFDDQAAGWSIAAEAAEAAFEEVTDEVVATDAEAAADESETTTEA
mgnify:CR=1 FL=1